MARFILKGAALALAIALTGTAIIVLPGGYLHELAAVINKRDILVSRKPPRLIFMGGSNLLSLNGPMLECELKMPVVNMGLYARIPMEDYYEDIARYLAPGDIIVIVQEYLNLLNTGSGIIPEDDRLRVEQFMFLLSPWKYAQRSIRRGTPFDIARIWANLIQLKLKNYIKFGSGGKMAVALKPGVPRFDDLYDANGDSRMSFAVIRPLDGKESIYPEPGPESIGHLRRIINDAEGRGARVFFSFAPFPESCFTLNRRQIGDLHAIMKKYMAASLINSPADHLYPEEYFADTVNHLQSAGEEMRSRKLVEALRAYVGTGRQDAEKTPALHVK